MNELELSKLPFEERIKHAPYSIWIDDSDYSRGDSVSSGISKMNDKTLFIETQSNCNGYRESVTISSFELP